MKAIVQSYNKENNKGVFLSSIPFPELIKKAYYTYKVESGEDITQENLRSASENFYQRELIPSHIKDIKKYIRETILSNEEDIALFPSSMLIAMNYDIPDKVNTSDIIDIELDQDLYVVDGQHRLFAMKNLYNEVENKTDEDSKQIQTYLEHFNFICSILINYDLWEQSLIFANVNFKQKKVNKSLYYDIYGSQYFENESDKKGNYIYVAHSLVKFLNSSQESPLKGYIKMLGTGHGIISQAFLVESILPMISSTRGIWYFNPAEKDMKTFSVRYMSNELVSYLIALQEEFKSLWPIRGIHISIILKTTGIGALIRLMSDIHNVLPSEIIHDLKVKTDKRRNDKYITFIKEHYLEKLKAKEDEFFSIDGDFSKRSGRASESALHKQMKNALGL